MASHTDTHLRQQVIYSVFVRNYSKEGTFAKLAQDLARIKALGTDIIWLMPIHPIGEVSRKGKLGSPYAIRDYRAVNPELGTMEDFKALVQAIHAHGMKCIIDVVYNHTSPDSWLCENHPEWFYRRSDGSFGNHVGEWTDIIDLDYRQRDLWTYQIDTLKMWAEIVDGFRCDVAPMVPLAFWLEARKQVAQVRPDCLWLAESADPGFIRAIRSLGLWASSDSELFQAFDMSYDYDIYGDYIRCFTGEGTLGAYLDKLNAQETVYPANYVKMHMLENHDQPRAAALIPDVQSLRNWTAFMYFEKGVALIYNGQEVGAALHPDLFDKDDIRWDTGLDLSALMRRLYAIRQDELFVDSMFTCKEAGNGVIFAERKTDDARMVGYFSTQGRSTIVRCDLPEGDYTNLIDGRLLRISNGVIALYGEPVILKLVYLAPRHT